MASARRGLGSLGYEDSPHGPLSRKEPGPAAASTGRRLSRSCSLANVSSEPTPSGQNASFPGRSLKPGTSLRNLASSIAPLDVVEAELNIARNSLDVPPSKLKRSLSKLSLAVPPPTLHRSPSLAKLQLDWAPTASSQRATVSTAKSLPSCTLPPRLRRPTQAARG